MKAPETIVQGKRENGFILATVLVFLVVLSLGAFFAARLTGANTQGVNNLQIEKQAFAIAEAGVDEALYRLNLKSPSCISMSIAPGITTTCTGTTFDGSIAPRIGSAPNRSLVGITTTNTASTTQILLSTGAPAFDGTNNYTTPSLQPAAMRIPYSTSAADAPVNLTTTSNLTIGWDLCSAVGTSDGCDNNAAHTNYDPYYPIRGLPLSSPRPVVKIVSTGTVQRTNGDVVASRKVVVRTTDCPAGSSNGNILTTGQACSDGISIGGSATITASGSIHVDAGSTGGACTSAMSTGGSSSITSTSGDITAVGGVSGSATSYTPDAKGNTDYKQDPYNDPPKPIKYMPCFGSRTTNCDSTYTLVDPADVRYGSKAGNAPLLVNAPTTLQPGIYYGGLKITSTGVVMQPGLYVMVGGKGGSDAGGFQVTTGSTQVSGTDLVIFNTLNEDPSCTSKCAGGSFDISSGNVGTTLTGRSTGHSYEEFVVFQDRAPGNNGDLPATQPEVFLQGGSTSLPLANGIVYAPDAVLHLQGNNPIKVAGTLVVKSITTSGSPSLDVQAGSGGGDECTGSLYTRLSWQDF